MTTFQEDLIDRARIEYHTDGTVSADTFALLAREGFLVRELTEQFAKEKELANG